MEEIIDTQGVPNTTSDDTEEEVVSESCDEPELEKTETHSSFSSTSQDTEEEDISDGSDSVPELEEVETRSIPSSTNEDTEGEDISDGGDSMPELEEVETRDISSSEDTEEEDVSDGNDSMPGLEGVVDEVPDTASDESLEFSDDSSELSEDSSEFFDESTDFSEDSSDYSDGSSEYSDDSTPQLEEIALQDASEDEISDQALLVHHNEELIPELEGVAPEQVSGEDTNQTSFDHHNVESIPELEHVALEQASGETPNQATTVSASDLSVRPKERKRTKPKYIPYSSRPYYPDNKDKEYVVELKPICIVCDMWITGRIWLPRPCGDGLVCTGCR